VEEEEEEEEGVDEEMLRMDAELAAKAAQDKLDAEKAAEEAALKKAAPEKKKTKAQLLLEKAAADEVLMIDALAQGYEDATELAFKDAVEIVCLEYIFQDELDQEMLRRPKQTDAEALEESTLQMSRLAKEKVATRRGLGRRLVYLSS